MAVQYAKYSVPFSDVNGVRYKVDIYGEVPTLEDVPPTITLLAGDNPLSIDEDDSKDFFAPVRTQTGNLTVCTKIEPQTSMPSGGILDIDEIMPINNTDTPVRVYKWDEDNSDWQLAPVWMGYLSCESYNQAYTSIPENLQLPIISVLEAWKSMYYSLNANVVSVATLISELMTGTYYHQQILQLRQPADGVDLWDSLINTSIFVRKVEYQDEESTLYKVEGSSYYDILESICRFMGWTARERGRFIYLQQMQGYGVLPNTATRQMSSLSWRGTNHQLSIVSGAKTVKVTSKLDDMDVNIKLPELPYGDLLESKDNKIDDAHQVYILPSTDLTAFSNINFYMYTGRIYLGDNVNPFSFQYVTDPSMSINDVIEKSVAYANKNSRAYLAFGRWAGDYEDDDIPYTRIYAGAFIARMQIDTPSEHDLRHQNTRDGIYLSLFPATWQERTEYNKPILEIRSVQAFAALEEGWLNLNALFSTFWDMPACEASPDPCQFMFQLQVGDRYWDGTTWRTYKAHFFPSVTNQVGKQREFTGNWNSSMDIDEVGGICIPSYFEEDGVIKHIMGEMVLRIFPETKRWDYSTPNPRNLVFDVFFERLDVTYIPKSSVERTDRSSNVFFKDIRTAFADNKSIENNLASWLNNNPSPSLLYKSDGSEPIKRLTYKDASNNNVLARPETVLLNRMAEYYRQPRTILCLEVQHIEERYLPLMRYNGLGDGKIYIPISESRDFRKNVSTINFMELPQ